MYEAEQHSAREREEEKRGGLRGKHEGSDSMNDVYICIYV